MTTQSNDNARSARQTQRTPGPWLIDDRANDDFWRITDAEGEFLFNLTLTRYYGHLLGRHERDKTAEANAAFIVTACNEYDSLKAQNTELVAALQLIEGTKGADAERVMREYARAALAKVTP